MIYLDNIITYKENSKYISFNKKLKIDNSFPKKPLYNNILSKSNNYKLYNDIFDNKVTYNNMKVKVMTMKQELFYLESIFIKDYFLNYYQTKFDNEIIRKKKIIDKKKINLKNKRLDKNILIKFKLEILNIIQTCINLYFKKIKYLNKSYYLNVLN